LVRSEGKKNLRSASRSRAANGDTPDAAGPLPEVHGGLEALAGGGAAAELPALRPDHLAFLSANGGTPDAAGLLPEVHGGLEALAGGRAATALFTLRPYHLALLRVGTGNHLWPVLQGSQADARDAGKLAPRADHLQSGPGDGKNQRLMPLPAIRLRPRCLRRTTRKCGSSSGDSAKNP
jgi:hypothetical protein